MQISLTPSRMSRFVDLHKAMPHMKQFWVFYLAALCAIFTVAVYYPGYMSPDSVAQLIQARNGVNSNLYPPLMDYIWSVTDRILPGPAGMLILNNVVFWFSLALIAFVVIARAVWRALFLLAAGFWPPTFGSIGTVWKDVGMQVFLFAALAAVLYAGYRRRMWPLGIAALALFVASGYRHNGLAAGVPMFVLIVLEAASLIPGRYPKLHGLLQRHNLGRVFYLGTGVFCIGFMLAALDFVNTYHVQDMKLWGGAVIHDLVAISVQQDRNYLPPYLNPDNLTVVDLRGMYTPLHVNALGDPSVRAMLGIVNPSQKRLGAQLLTDAQGHDLQSRWLTAVLDNFGSYLHHRMAIASVLLVVDAGHPWYPYANGIDPNPFGLKFKPSPLNTAVMGIIRDSAFRTVIWSAWFYYVIVAACLIISFLWDFAYARTVQVLAISTYLYFLSIFMFGVSGDFRYNIWALSCAYVCPVLLFAGRMRWTADGKVGLLSRESNQSHNRV